jgi:hypothetical protein
VSGVVGGALPAQTNLGDADAFVRKYDRHGDEVWTLQFGTPFSDSAMGISAAESGELYFAGVTNGTLPGETAAGDFDAFVVKIVSMLVQ